MVRRHKFYFCTFKVTYPDLTVGLPLELCINSFDEMSTFTVLPFMKYICPSIAVFCDGHDLISSSEPQISCIRSEPLIILPNMGRWLRTPVCFTAPIHGRQYLGSLAGSQTPEGLYPPLQLQHRVYIPSRPSPRPIASVHAQISSNHETIHSPLSPGSGTINNWSQVPGLRTSYASNVQPERHLVLPFSTESQAGLYEEADQFSARVQDMQVKHEDTQVHPAYSKDNAILRLVDGLTKTATEQP